MPPTLLWCPLNPQSKDAPVFLPADSPLVEATACLGWQPAQPHGGVSCVSLGQFQMIRAFISRCSIPRGGGDEDAAADVNLLATRFPASTWSRILTELEASGLVADFTAACVDHRPIPSTLERCLARLKVLNPEQLLLHAADFSAAGEAFETAAVLGHGRGRGRGAVGIPSFSGPINLRFLGLLTPLDFEEQGAEAPLMLLSRICGMLGPCLTQASRQDERSTVAIIGETLRTQLLARGGGGEDGSLADAVPDYIRSISLPGLFAAGAAGVDDLRMEAKDMMAYHRSILGRREVERSKIHHGRDGYLQGWRHPACPPILSRPRLFSRKLRKRIPRVLRLKGTLPSNLRA
jgi:hypothetical protein